MNHGYNAKVGANEKGGLKQLFSSWKLFRNSYFEKGKVNGEVSHVKSTKDTVKVSGVYVLSAAPSQLKM